MADNVVPRDEEVLRAIRTLLWANSVKEDVFKRWAQGFIFSQDEPTALVQFEGGPCAVIAPVQAFILKQLLIQLDINSWKTLSPSDCYKLLIQASLEILNQASSEKSQPRFSLVHQDEQKSQESKPEKEEEEFNSRLRISYFDTLEEVEEFLKDKLDMLKDRYGILLLLYSVIATKGISDIQQEMSDPLEPMIDSTYGYGSQSLINLMLTGRAVSHVWDHDQNIGGLKLQGIDKQNPVGFLALLEHLRYCEVGTFLKSPSHPVWVLGSETHLTVLFSPVKGLVSPETPAEQAKRVFRTFDPEGNNFIPANLLQDLLAQLGLVADTEYVDIMRKKLDNENLGIILRASFMEEFFPEEPWSSPDTFDLYHYNGLLRSNPVKYRRGQAVLLECTVKGILESNPMLTVLQTKWPRIEIQWDDGRNPSLN